MKGMWLLVGAIFVVGLWFLTPWLAYDVIGLCEEQAGQFGDMFGAVNALFSGLAFAGLLFTIYLQRKEIVESRKDFSKERFETTFFSMLALHNEMVSKLRVFTTLTSNGREFAEGREIFEKRMYKDLREHLRRLNANSPSDSEENKINNAYLTFYKEHGSLLGHYFRFLYNTVKFVDRSSVTDKKFYTNLVRAQLSDYELVILFYNCLSEYGREKFKPLIEDYGLLKHVSDSLLLGSSHRKHYDPSAFGKTN